MKRSTLMVAVAILAAFACANIARAEAAKTVTGKSACATCSGVTSAGHAIMLVTANGERWVLIGDDATYKAAHDVRKDDKTMTATLAGEPVVKKDENGKEYKEVKVVSVKVES